VPDAPQFLLSVFQKAPRAVPIGFPADLRLMGKLRKIASVAAKACRSPFYGFIEGHSELTSRELAEIGALVGKGQLDVVTVYEEKFASLVGNGECVAFAAGRMGFFAIMQLLGIGAGDEVILPGATCSVMVNAVLRVGAIPVYADIDRETLGSSPSSITKCITAKTRLIVAQHSFGIPCDIAPIREIASSRGIFLLEDCALTLGSEVNGVAVGNFGDAALFSTDHTKPLNTLIGGLIYSRDGSLISKLRHFRDACPDLPVDRQKALWRRLRFERLVCRPDRHGWFGLLDAASGVANSVTGKGGAFLTDDFRSLPGSRYPYPARLPAFIARLGLTQAEDWEKKKQLRKDILRQILSVVEASPMRHCISPAYRDLRLDIVPLRFAWVADEPGSRNHFSAYIDTSWTWFMQPIVATNEPLSNFGYRAGCCPISEDVGLSVVNVPCNVRQDHVSGLMKLLSETINC
jgi:perosamine synthetase